MTPRARRLLEAHAMGVAFLRWTTLVGAGAGDDRERGSSVVDGGVCTRGAA